MRLVGARLELERAAEAAYRVHFSRELVIRDAEVHVRLPPAGAQRRSALERCDGLLGAPQLAQQRAEVRERVGELRVDAQRLRVVRQRLVGASLQAQRVGEVVVRGPHARAQRQRPPVTRHRLLDAPGRLHQVREVVVRLGERGLGAQRLAVGALGALRVTHAVRGKRLPERGARRRHVARRAHRRKNRYAGLRVSSA